MIRFIALLLLGLFTSLVFADPKPSKQQVDWTEIARWGDRVVVSGEGPTSVDDLLFSMAMAPPEDDSDMWYITLWSMKTCPACKTLVSNFEKDDNLTPFVAPPPGSKKPWAHFNVYQLEDPTQKWRFKDFKTEGGPFPILTIQPPRNKVFGDPRIIVDRIEGRDIGKPADLKKRIIQSVDFYCKKLKDSGYIPPASAIEKYGHDSKTGYRGHEASLVSYGHGQLSQEAHNHPTDRAKNDPITGPTGPWGPDPPAPTPFNPQYPQFPPQGPAQQPVFASGGGDITDTLFGPKMAGFFLAILAVLRLLDTFGPMFGIKTGTFKGLLEFMEKLQPAPALAPATPGSQLPQANLQLQTPTITVVNPQPSGLAAGFILLSNGQIVATPSK